MKATCLLFGVIAGALLAEPAAPPAPFLDGTPATPDGDVSAMSFPSTPAQPPASPEQAPSGGGAATATPGPAPAQPEMATSAPAPRPATHGTSQASALLGPSKFDHVYHFKDSGIDDVITLLTGDFRTPIILNADFAGTISGDYKADTLDGILRLLCSDAGLRFDRRAGAIYISSITPTRLQRVSLRALTASEYPGTTPPVTPSAKSVPATASNTPPNSYQSTISPVNATAPSHAANPPAPVSGSPGGVHFASRGGKEPDADAELRKLAARRAKLLQERNTLLAGSP